jgi:CheY-like chemotaxis protein
VKLLAVDDNLEVTDVLSFFCESKNIECIIINKGIDGLAAIRKGGFDLIIMDLAMPEFSGYDILEALKKDNLITSRNIVILTASGSVNEQELYDAGVKAILKKPFMVSELEQLIQKYRRTS